MGGGLHGQPFHASLLPDLGLLCDAAEEIALRSVLQPQPYGELLMVQLAQERMVLSFHKAAHGRPCVLVDLFSDLTGQDRRELHRLDP